MQKLDQNQIAARTLRIALRRLEAPSGPKRPQAVSPRSIENLEPYKHLHPTRRAELARMGALARWGSATLRIMPKDSSSVDANQLAKRILDEATGEAPKTQPPAPKNQAAVELGRLGGAKGGAARKAALTEDQRKEIAKKAAAKRWGK
jgi:hypothetical protein